jgi:2-polyprenyl-3-methyl-5-hydroxy-6-metoxy-1,4-benzoquinol methylase/GT2 family glycosyltransferase
MPEKVMRMTRDSSPTSDAKLEMSKTSAQIHSVPLTHCWCGSESFKPFNDDYQVCEACGTLLCKSLPADDVELGRDGDLYSKDYWLDYQTTTLHQPTVVERSRTDLSERCLYWLRTLLKYKRPPGRVLEVGCAHGGFTAVMKEAGFEAKAVELSPWVIDFAQRTFDIEVLRGPLDPNQIEAGSLDAIVLLDVLEHLPDPAAVVRDFAKLLKPDGVLLIQTPQWRPEKTHTGMRLANDPFLHQLMPLEHLYLFNETSVVDFFKRQGFEHIVFEPAIFAIYDMFFVASRQELTAGDEATVAAALDRPGSPRLVQALLDLYGRHEAMTAERLRLYTDHHIMADQLIETQAQHAEIRQLLAGRTHELHAAQAEMQVLAARALRAEGKIINLSRRRIKVIIGNVLQCLGLLRGASKLWRTLRRRGPGCVTPAPALPRVDVGQPILLDEGIQCNGPLLIAANGPRGDGMEEVATLTHNGVIRTSPGDGLSPDERIDLQPPITGSLMAWLISPNAPVLRQMGTIVAEATDAATLGLLRGRVAPGQSLLLCGPLPATPLIQSLGEPTSILDGRSFFTTLPAAWLDPLDETLAPRPEILTARQWPKISVVMVSYNQGEFLEEGILSVLNQSYPNLEILVVDAVSTDGSLDILERYRDRLDLLLIEKDHGQSDGLNKGFDRATGDIVTWVNSDDLLEPGSLFRVAQAFTDYKVDMVVGGCRQIGVTRATTLLNHHTRLPLGRVVPLPLDKLLDFHNYWQTGAFFFQPEVFFSRDLWKRSGGALRLDLNYVLDYDLWVRMAAAGAKCVHIPDYLACSRTHENQKTTYGKMPYLPEVRRLLLEYHDVSRPIGLQLVRHPVDEA